MSSRSGDDVDLVEADDNLRSAISELERIADEYDDRDAMSTLDDLRDDIDDLRDDLDEAEGDYDDLRAATDRALRQFESDLNNVADRLDDHENVSINYDSFIEGDINITIEESGKDGDGIYLTKRQLLAGGAVMAGTGAAVAAPYSFGGSFLGGFFGASGGSRPAPAPEPERGAVNQELFNIAWGEMGEQKYTLLSQDAYQAFTNGEGTDLAMMDVRFEPGNSEYRFYHIDTGKVSDNGWKDATSVQELLSDYGTATQQPSDWNYLDNDNIAEYLTDLSKSKNPEKLDFDDYLED
ncbi:MAG: hypothetical protein ABEJ99_05745 [Candidatus Nanohaloarchaea archaeon]